MKKTESFPTSRALPMLKNRGQVLRFALPGYLAKVLLDNRSTAEIKKPESWLMVDWVLSSFSTKKSTALKRYQEFVSDGKNQAKPWQQLRNQIYPGGEDFVEEMQCNIKQDKDLSEIPSSQKRQVTKPLSYYENKCSERNGSIIKAYESGGYSLKAIGDYFELYYSRVSRIVKAKGKT